MVRPGRALPQQKRARWPAGQDALRQDVVVVAFRRGRVTPSGGLSRAVPASKTEVQRRLGRRATQQCEKLHAVAQAGDWTVAGAFGDGRTASESYRREEEEERETVN